MKSDPYLYILENSILINNTDRTVLLYVLDENIQNFARQKLETNLII